jgi:hypothetical protein
VVTLGSGDRYGFFPILGEIVGLATSFVLTLGELDSMVMGFLEGTGLGLMLGSGGTTLIFGFLVVAYFIGSWDGNSV